MRELHPLPLHGVFTPVVARSLHLRRIGEELRDNHVHSIACHVKSLCKTPITQGNIVVKEIPIDPVSVANIGLQDHERSPRLKDSTDFFERGQDAGLGFHVL